MTTTIARPRFFITATPSALPIVEKWHRHDLRRHYRTLRRLGMSPTRARHFLVDIIKSASYEVLS